MKAFDLKPGRHIGDIRDRLDEAVIQGELPPRAEFAVYLAWLESNEGVVADARESADRPRRPTRTPPEESTS